MRKKEATKVKPDGSGKSKREHDNRFTLAAAEWDRIRDTSDIDRLVRFEKHFAGTYYAEEAASRRLELEADAQRRREAENANLRQEAEKKRVLAEQQRLKVRPGVTEAFRDVPEGPELVVVPAGSFFMGSPETKPKNSRSGRMVLKPRRTR